MSANKQGPGGDVPSVVSLICGALAYSCTVMVCFSPGFPFIMAIPLALWGIVAACFGSGDLMINGIVLNALALGVAILLLILDVYVASAAPLLLN